MPTLTPGNEVPRHHRMRCMVLLVLFEFVGAQRMDDFLNAFQEFTSSCPTYTVDNSSRLLKVHSGYFHFALQGLTKLNTEDGNCMISHWSSQDLIVCQILFLNSSTHKCVMVSILPAGESRLTFSFQYQA